MPEQRHVATHVQPPPNDGLCPGSHLAKGLATGGSVGEDGPAGVAGANLILRETFATPVIPLHQIGFVYRDLPESGQLACPPRALQWTGQHQ